MRLRRLELLAGVLALTLVTATSARAQVDQVDFDQPRSLGASCGAALVNAVYFPIRLGVSAVGVGLSGISGWLTGGDHGVADDVWNQFRGPAYVTPGMLKGQERFRLGPWQTGH